MDASPGERNETSRSMFPPVKFVLTIFEISGAAGTACAGVRKSFEKGKIKKLLSKAKRTTFEIRLNRLLSLLSSPKSEVSNSPDPTPHKEPPPLGDY